MSSHVEEPGWTLAVDLLRSSRALVEELHRRLARTGHPRLRPAHGFVLQIVAAGETSASEIAALLGITKQAARLMIDELEAWAYVERGHDVSDRRRRPVRLAEKGRDALARSSLFFDELRDELAAELGAQQFAAGRQMLEAVQKLYGPAPLRPVW